MCGKIFLFSCFFLVPFSSLTVNIHAYSCFSTVYLKISPSLHFNAIPCRPEMTLYERVITAQSNGEEKWQWGNVAKNNCLKEHLWTAHQFWLLLQLRLLVLSSNSRAKGISWCNPVKSMAFIPGWLQVIQVNAMDDGQSLAFAAQLCIPNEISSSPEDPGELHMITLNQICPRALKSARWCKIWNNGNWKPELVLQKDWYLLLK